jgi:hypothetical protein
VTDRWAALQFDNAVGLVGTVLENAAQEQTNVGTKNKPEWKPTYTLGQLLADDFRLPAPEKPKSGIEGLLSMKGVKVWR